LAAASGESRRGRPADGQRVRGPERAGGPIDERRAMSSDVYAVSEIVGSSTDSIEGAIENALTMKLGFKMEE
jgi:hypothetical protein